MTVYAAVWWERSELESLKAEKATLQENIANFDKLKGRIKIVTCDKRPCVEVETKSAYGKDEDHRFYILKGIK
jgi:hypothetical protein